MNNKIIRILFNKQRDTPVRILYNCLNTLPIPLLHEFKILQFVHNCIYNKFALPDIFHNYFNCNNTVHCYITGKNCDLFVSLPNSRFGDKTIQVKGSRLWNSLPMNIKIIANTVAFKKSVKNYLLQSM